MEVTQVLQRYVSSGFGSEKWNCKDLQETEAEHDNQSPLLPSGQLQRPDHRQRQYEERNVGDEVEAGHDIPDGQRVQTFTLNRGVPERRDRHADQGQKERNHDRPRADEGHASRRNPLHEWAGEDSAVLEQDRDLHDAHGDVVKDDRGVE